MRPAIKSAFCVVGCTMAPPVGCPYLMPLVTCSSSSDFSRAFSSEDAVLAFLTCTCAVIDCNGAGVGVGRGGGGGKKREIVCGLRRGHLPNQDTRLADRRLVVPPLSDEVVQVEVVQVGVVEERVIGVAHALFELECRCRREDDRAGRHSRRGLARCRGEACQERVRNAP
eukprot:2857799-Prymnesium_polylepis.2